MEIIRADIPGDCTIVLDGDSHLGSLNCHKQLIRRKVHRVAEDPNCFIVNHGDNVEAILPNDKRYLHADRDWVDGIITPQDQRDEFIDIHQPVADRFLAIGEGNHEYKLWNTLSIGQDISSAFKVPYGGYNFVIHYYVDGELAFQQICSHGSGTMPKGAKDPVQREANQKAWLKRKMDGMGFADCILQSMGHTHRLMVVDPTINTEKTLTTSTGDIHQRGRDSVAQNAPYIAPERRWTVNTGSALKLYSPPGSRVFGYAERAQLTPADLGWAEVDVRAGEVIGVRKVEQ